MYIGFPNYKFNKCFSLGLKDPRKCALRQDKKRLLIHLLPNIKWKFLLCYNNGNKSQ